MRVIFEYILDEYLIFVNHSYDISHACQSCFIHGVGSIMDQIQNEDTCQGKMVEWLTKKIESEERAIKDISSTSDSTFSELNQKQRDLEQKRADNLKELLQLQQRWKQIEAENLRELEERKKMELLHHQTLRENEAATFLQQKLRKCISKNVQLK